jgi:oxygen-independent coproporphyrinogen-3 oxidase
MGFKSVNLDLIYGLLKQTTSSWTQTLQSVVQLRPDRIALYAYAHLHARFKPQRHIHASDLPTV